MTSDSRAGTTTDARRWLAATAAVALATSVLSLGGGPARAVPSDASALAATSAPARHIDVTPNPWYTGEPFEGWGTSLVWFANATGDYPDELRGELYDLLFSDSGLDLNLARYNIGGGNASDVEPYLRPGGAVDGWWQPDPDGTTGLYADAAGPVATDVASKDAVRDSFDAADDDYYDLDADATQRWWLEQLVADDQITHWEAFANSAPWFMTESGYVSGGFDASAEQLDPDAVEEFSAYLVRVVDRLEETSGARFDTIDPLNEPNTNYWGTQLGADGQPTGGRQEGMHVGAARQVPLIKALRDALAADGVDTEAVISAMDETNPSTFASNWSVYDREARDAVEQLNVHTYGTGGRLRVRDQSKVADKPLWMSEVEGNWSDSDGFDPADIDNGLGFAERINSDLRELEAAAWVLWQPVEDLYNMDGVYDDSENLNWGSVYIDFDCRYYDEDGDGVDDPDEFKSARRVRQEGGDPTAVEPCGIRVNSKFNVMRNYTAFVRPGDRLVPSDDADTTAAVGADGAGLTLVHANPTEQDTTVTVDLSRFGRIEAGATATAYETTEPASAATVEEVTAAGVVEQAPVPVDTDAEQVTIEVPAKSVTTIVVDGVAGVADDAPGLRDGETYQLVGDQSGRALTDASGQPGAAAATTITDVGETGADVADQLWTAHAVAPGAQSETRRYVLTTPDGGVLSATPDGTEIVAGGVAQAAERPQATWILNTTDGEAWSLVNAGLTQALDVGGQQTADGSAVGTFDSGGGRNQAWELRSTIPTGAVEQQVVTPVGVAPRLPQTATPRYPWGRGVPVDVVWDSPAGSVWDTPGEVEVTGQATDVYGQVFAAVVTVVVGEPDLADPTSVTVAEGSTLDAVRSAAPATVDVRVGSSPRTFERAVTWDWSGLDDGDFSGTGVVTVPGTADGLEAVLSVLVTGADASTNLCGSDDVAVTATYTEAGYTAQSTCDGDPGTRWSSYSSAGRTGDTLTYELPGDRLLNSVRLASAERAPLTATVEYRADGVWTETSAGTVEDLGTGAPTTIGFDAVETDAVRVVLTTDHYAKVSEVEVGAVAASPASVSTLAALRLDGVPLGSFDPDVTDYRAGADGDGLPRLDALPTDRAARVDVDQADAADPVARATVTSADGTSTTTYTVDLDPGSDPVRSRLTVTVQRLQAPHGPRARVRVTTRTDVRATGTVRLVLHRGQRTLDRRTTTLRKERATWHLRGHRLPRGRYRLEVVYLGSTEVAGSRKVVAFRVR